MKKLIFICAAVLIAGAFIPANLAAQAAQPINLDPGAFFNPDNFSISINLLLSLAMISFIPFFIVSTTSFLRSVIILSLIRQALGTQQAPPNMVIIALALFMTVFIMTPTLDKINEVAYKPYQEGKISQKEALTLGAEPLKEFMLKLTRDKDLALFIQFSHIQTPENYENIPIYILIPAFLISELKTAFQIGFLLFIPFLAIDLITANILLSLGMFMLSPAMVSLPFKILLFVLTDGWNLIIQGILVSFR
ncbi:flagellar type III secretion system pore protein FliP [Thermoproteota archaeon]